MLDKVRASPTNPFPKNPTFRELGHETFARVALPKTFFKSICFEVSSIVFTAYIKFRRASSEEPSSQQTNEVEGRE